MKNFMEGFKPENTPEANANARKRLSLHLTGEENATEEEMIEVIEGENKRKDAASPLSGQIDITEGIGLDSDPSTLSFISAYDDYVKGLEERAEAALMLPPKEGRREAESCLAKMNQDIFKISGLITDFESTSGLPAKRKIRRLNERMEKVRKKLGEILQKTSWDSQGDFGE